MAGHDYTPKAPDLAVVTHIRSDAAQGLLCSTKHMTKLLFRILSNVRMMHTVTTRF